MTVVAALVTPKGSWMGADSLASDGQGVAVTSATPKCARFGGLLLGVAGSWGVWEQVSRWAQSQDNPTVDGLVKGFHPRGTGSQWELLAIEKGQVYEIASGRGVFRQAVRQGTSYSAIGSGAHAALGALYVGHRGRNDLLLALEAACAHTTTCRAPLYIVE